jgi:hypothetical protein
MKGEKWKWNMPRFILIFLCFKLDLLIAARPDIDPNGYIMFCPCMGKLSFQIFLRHFILSVYINSRHFYQAIFEC